MSSFVSRPFSDQMKYIMKVTFSSTAEPPSRRNVVGPFQGKMKTHKMNRYFWVCSEKAVESTSPKKCSGQEKCITY